MINDTTGWRNEYEVCFLENKGNTAQSLQTDGVQSRQAGFMQCFYKREWRTENGSQVGEAVIVRSDAAGTIAVVFAVLLFACKAVFDKGTAVSD